MKSNEDTPTGARIREAFMEILDDASNSEIARIMKTTPAQLTNWMSRDIVPKRKDLLRIREITGYSIEYLLFDQLPKKVAELQIAASQLDLEQEKIKAVKSYLLEKVDECTRKEAEARKTKLEDSGAIRRQA